MTRIVALLVFGLLPTLALAQPDRLTENIPPQARQTLESWLQLVDQGEFVDAWQQAGDKLQQAVSRQDWLARFQALEFADGRIRQRRLVNEAIYQLLPDAEPGQYLVSVYASQFGTSLQDKGEVVTVSQEPSGWQVVGYYRLDKVPQALPDD
jgi:hypothetical protein